MPPEDSTGNLTHPRLGSARFDATRARASVGQLVGDHVEPDEGCAALRHRLTAPGSREGVPEKLRSAAFVDAPT
jgi:hypothetical protein